jgi:ABC-2 type transport system permease protein
MKNKLWFLTSVSLKRKIKTKWFFLANILLCLGIVGILNIHSIIQFFGGDFDEPTKVYILDETGVSFDILKDQIEEVEEGYYGEDSNTYEVLVYEEKEPIRDFLKDKDKNVAFIIKDSEETILDVTLISDGYIDSVDYQLLSTAINNTKTILATKRSNIDLEELNKITGSLEIKREILDETKKTEDENMGMVMTTVFPMMILPFFMLTIFLVQMIGAEVNDEKTTRGMEIIISNVPAKTHFFSKILAGNLFVLLQGILLIFYTILGFIVKNMFASKHIFSSLDSTMKDMVLKVFDSSFAHQLVYLIPLTLLLMLITFIAYSLLAGILASITTNTEDFQQLQTPIMVILLVGYYLAVMASTFKGSLFIRILSYVPLISAILSPSLLVVGQIGMIDVILSIIIALLFDYLLVHFGLRVYKVGILNYSSEGLWKKLWKAIKGGNI